MLVVGLLSCRSSPSTYIWPARQKGTPNTHIWSCSKLQSHQKGPALTFTSMIGNHITNICEMALHLYLTYSLEGHNPIQDGTTSAHNDERTLFFLPRLEPHPLTMMKDSHPGWNHIRSQWWKTLIQDRTISAHNDERFVHSHLIW